VTDILEATRRWIDSDPDPSTRHALQLLLDSKDVAELQRAMGTPLTFGTAGIRGEVGPGSGRMNRATVIRTTRGIADHLLNEHGGLPAGPVVLGFDARPDSRQFAEDAAGILAAAGIAVLYFPEVTPTPLVAFASKHLGAPAAIVITASHNPPADNGYKVYGENAAQIVPPTDIQIAHAIERVGPAAGIPRLEGVFTGASELVKPIDLGIVDDYRIEVDEARPHPQRSKLKTVYTPLHGVGADVLIRMFAAAQHSGLITVPEQVAPDGRFPTLRFPNPEEPGALDLALALAVEEGADLLLANDPDADRLAAAVPNEGGWRMLTGNELGAILRDYVLRYWDHQQAPIVVNSIVSSPMMARIAASRGAIHETTLTGFKWIINAGLTIEARGDGRFAFGYEEALGYSIGRTVRDKDGISAAIVMADLAAEEAAADRDVMVRLHDLWDEVGLWVSAQHAIVRTGDEGQRALLAAVDRLATSPPTEVKGMAVTEMTDYRVGEGTRPSWLGAQDLVELALGDVGRILVRPSGTEPKLKIYVDLSGTTEPDAETAHRLLLEKASAMAAEMGEWLAV